MKEKDRNSKIESAEFLRYAKGEMTDRERNEFERELQRDPFAEEAAEGLSEISIGEAVSDLDKLEKRLRSRIYRKRKLFYYRIAASVAVLMIISSVFIIINKNKPAGELANITAVQVPLEIPQSQAITEPPGKIQETEYSKLPAAEKPAEKRVQKAVPPEIVAYKGEKNVTGTSVQSATIVRTEVTGVAANIQPDKPVVPVASVSREEPREILVSGKIISSEDNLPLHGVNVTLKGRVAGVLTDTEGKFNIALPDTEQQTLIASYIGMESKEFEAKSNTEMEISLDPSMLALEEVVVVEYGVSKTHENIQPGYSPPQPEQGKKSFNRYIKENIKNPGTLSPGQKAVVVVGFTVRSAGDIDSIKVIRSPGPEFSEEAIRLIKEGPDWKPATENGKTINDKVRIRIVFL